MADRWFGINSTNLHSFCGELPTFSIADGLDGTGCWKHLEVHQHWFVLDLKKSYAVKRVRGRSNGTSDPTRVDIYVSEDGVTWGDPVQTNIATWQDTSTWQAVTVTEKNGRYIRVVVRDTEDSLSLVWGDCGSPFAIIDVYLDDIASAAVTSGVAGFTAQALCEAAGRYWYNNTCNDTPFFTGTQDVSISGYLTRYQKRQIIGFYPASGDLRSVTVNASGHLFTDVEVEVSSGLWVDGISGQHVFVESGVFVIADVEVDVSSGIHVLISGQHVYVESGVYLASGMRVVTSGEKIDAVLYGIDGQSGIIPLDAVYPEKTVTEEEVGLIPFAYNEPDGVWLPFMMIEDGIVVNVQSGLLDIQSGAHVQISGQHVFVESGVHVLISGQHIHTESGDLIDAIIYGTEWAGSPYGSGTLRPIMTWGGWPIVAGGVNDGVCSGFYAPIPLTWGPCDDIFDLKVKCTVSGDHVFVESGVFLASGLHVVTEAEITVDISGDSIIISGQPVTISGDHVFVESGVFLASGLHVVADIAESGMGVQIQSGVHVQISGQHVFVESGVHVVSASGTLHTVVDVGDIYIFASGHRAYVSRRHMGLTTTPESVVSVHNGELYIGHHCFLDVGSGQNSDLLIVTASGKETHTIFDFGGGGAYVAYLYENVQCTDSGTPFTAHNMNRPISGTTNVLLSHTPTVTSTATELWCGIAGSKTTEAGGPHGGQTIQGGTTIRDVEWILDGVSGPVNYLLRMANRAENIVDQNINVQFTEEEEGLTRHT